MNLILQNRFPQSLHVHFRHLDGERGHCDISSGAEGSIPIQARTLPDGSRLSTPAETLAFVLGDLARFGLTSSDTADRYDAARNPLGPPWKGIAYRVDGSP